MSLKATKNADISVSGEPPTSEPHAREGHVYWETVAGAFGPIPVFFNLGAVPRKKRVIRIVDVMLERRWVRGETARELAAEWGHALGQIEKDASDAAIILQLAREPETVREFGLAHLRRITEESTSDMARVQAITTALKATGNLVNEHKHDVSVRQGPAAESTFARALEHPAFRAWVESKLLSEGWQRPVLTDGTELK